MKRNSEVSTQSPTEETCAETCLPEIVDRLRRQQLMRGAFGIQALMMFICTLLVIVALFVIPVRDYLHANAFIFYIFLVIFIVIYLVLLYWDTWRRTPPQHYSALVLFTLFLGLMLASAAALYCYIEILFLLVGLFLATLATALWSLCRHNLAGWGVHVWVCAIVWVAAFLVLGLACGLSVCGLPSISCSSNTKKHTTTPGTTPPRNRIRRYISSGRSAGYIQKYMQDTNYLNDGPSTVVMGLRPTVVMNGSEDSVIQVPEEENENSKEKGKEKKKKKRKKKKKKKKKKKHPNKLGEEMEEAEKETEDQETWRDTEKKMEEQEVWRDGGKKMEVQETWKDAKKETEGPEARKDAEKEMKQISWRAPGENTNSRDGRDKKADDSKKEKEATIRVFSLIIVTSVVFVLAMYMIFDTQLMLEDRQCCAVASDEYIFAALSVWTDIVGFCVDFLYYIGLLSDEDPVNSCFLRGARKYCYVSGQHLLPRLTSQQY